MLEIRRLSKETVYAVMADTLYSLNYGWIKLEDLLLTKYPEARESQEYLKLNEDVGSYEAKRLLSTLRLSGAGIDLLIELLKYSHWAVFENIQTEKLTAKSFKMRTIDCSAQKAAKRRGAKYYDCRVAATAIRNGFYEAANKNAKVKCIFTPAEIRPEGCPEHVSCEWIISIE